MPGAAPGSPEKQLAALNARPRPPKWLARLAQRLPGRLLPLAATLLAGCNAQYVVRNNQVYIKSWNEADGTRERPVAGADARTFQPFKTDANVLLGRDQYHVFVDGGVLPRADPNTLTYLGSYFLADKRAVYFEGFRNDSSGYEVPGADPRTTHATRHYPWAYDSQHVLYGYDLVPVAASTTLVGLSEDWAKTDRQVLYKRKIVPNADAATFRVLNDYTAQDKYRQYHGADY